MAKIAGRKGRIYLGLTSAGQAQPLVNQSKWSINFTTGKLDATAMGDATKQYVSDTPDATGTFEGFLDDTVDTTYAAAIDGQARRFYLYPTVDSPGTYWYGLILPDLTVTGGVGTVAGVSSSWAAAGPILKSV